MRLQAYALGGLLAGLVAIGPAVAANTESSSNGGTGTTSGPAVGTTVTPSTATNKGHSAGNPGMAGPAGCTSRASPSRLCWGP